MKKLSLQDLEIKDKKVLMRVDFNIPLRSDGTPIDDTRIRLTLPSIEYVLAQGGILILMSHFGRPKGEFDSKLSLKPCAEHLSILLKREVRFESDCIGKNVEQSVQELKSGDILLLENLRFHKGEEHPEKDPEFVKQLAKLGDLYVNDAFGASHRKHTSITIIPEFFPKKSAMGFLMEKEVSYFSQIVLSPKHPFYAIIGGAKTSTKLGILDALVERVDGIFIGGGMAFTFFKAQGLEIGNSICDLEKLASVQGFMKLCEEKAIQFHLPKDLVITNGRETQIILPKDGIPNGWTGMDIGPRTVEEWSAILQKGSTIFWNGPLGVFELAEFAHGTNRLAQNLSTMAGTVIVGGGDSVAAINALHLEKSFDHLSSGGGASLEFIEYGHLPGIDALTNK